MSTPPPPRPAPGSPAAAAPASADPNGRKTVPVRFEPLAPAVEPPRRHSAHASGFDLRAAPSAGPIVLEPGARAAVPCGFRMALPPGWEAQVRPRSGLAARFGVTTLNAPGTIDADYRGEVRVLLVNHGAERFVVDPGMRIAQMVIAPVFPVAFEVIEEGGLDETERGTGGFGSTGLA